MEDSKLTGWQGINKRIHPSGFNLQCACGRWCTNLFILESKPDVPMCAGCIKRARKEKEVAGRD